VGVGDGRVVVGDPLGTCAQLTANSLDVTTEPSTPITRSSYLAADAAGAAIVTLSLPGWLNRTSSP
jgi:hypothetical protein